MFWIPLLLCCVSFCLLGKILLVARIQTIYARCKQSGYAILGKMDFQRPVRAAKKSFRLVSCLENIVHREFDFDAACFRISPVLSKEKRVRWYPQGKLLRFVTCACRTDMIFISISTEWIFKVDVSQKQCTYYRLFNVTLFHWKDNYRHWFSNSNSCASSDSDSVGNSRVCKRKANFHNVKLLLLNFWVRTMSATAPPLLH